MGRALLLTIRFHDGRYHGAGDWPPSPARLFQALVAGAGLSGLLRRSETTPALAWLERPQKPVQAAQSMSETTSALAWLERKAPPLIAAPWSRRGQAVLCYMLNNDAERVGGDPTRLAKIRTAEKVYHPVLFDNEVPFLYAWALEDARDEESAMEVCRSADRLYQLGCGLDMAWAWGELVDGPELDARLSAYAGTVLRPSAVGSGLDCPCEGSLASLQRRYASPRFGRGDDAAVFSPRPPPVFRRVNYDDRTWRGVFTLRAESPATGFFAFPLARTAELVTWLRDETARRLTEALPPRRAEIERVLVGRKPDGTNDGPASERVRFIPLASIGHEHVDREIRRVLVEVPAACPLRADDVRWAISGLVRADAETGEASFTVTPTDEDAMLAHYVKSSILWRTVTPAALPEIVRRRRIDPERQAEEAKGGAERMDEHANAAGAVMQALRHAQIDTRPEAIRVQREPFEGRGQRVEAFAEGTRFDKHRLWHVEITFERSLRGPVIIGDGRFFGLGVLAPVHTVRGLHVFAVEGGLTANASPLDVTRAARRAVMARVQAVLGDGARLPSFFSGHGGDGRPARAPREGHLVFAFDPRESRILVIAPHVLERRNTTKREAEQLATLERALADFRELRAGAAGVLTLCPRALDLATDLLMAPRRIWENVTPYTVTRHAKGVGAFEAVRGDLMEELRRRGLPEAEIAVDGVRGIAREGVVARLRLAFRVAVSGPILLGRSRHLGGGLFAHRATKSDD